MTDEQYGRTGMFTSAVTVIYIFAILGMDQTYIRYYYKEGVDRHDLMKRCLLPALAIVGVLCALYAVLSGPANDFLFGERGIDLTILVIAYTVISVFERFLFLDIRMSQNGKLYSNLNILSKILYIAFILLFFAMLGDNYRVVMLAMTLSLGLVTFGIGVRYLGNQRRGLAEASLPRYELSQRELIKYGMPFILVLLMEWLLSSCDKWALRVWSGYGELGIYNSAMNIMSILLTFKATFVAFWSPVAMEKYENDSYENCKAFFKSAFNITRFYCVCAGFGLILFKDIIVYLLGADFRRAVHVIPFLTLMPIFSILFEITNQGIKFTKKNRYLNYASAVAIICNVAGNALLVPKLGGAGAALATGVTYMAYFAIGSFFAEKCYKVGYENVKTVVYAVMLMGYACLATFTEGYLIPAVAGIVGLAVVIAADYKVLLVSIEYVVGVFKKKTKA